MIRQPAYLLSQVWHKAVSSEHCQKAHANLPIFPDPHSKQLLLTLSVLQLHLHPPP